jgi:hypothetical protein
VPGTKRIPIARAHHPRISADAVRLYTYIRQRQAAGMKPGSDDYNSLAICLHRALDRKPWDPDLLAIDPDGKPPLEFERLKAWRAAVELLHQLDEAIAQHGRPAHAGNLVSHP